MASLRESRVRSARRRRTAALILAGVWLAVLLWIGFGGIPGVSRPATAFAQAAASATTPTTPAPTSPIPTTTVTPVDLTPTGSPIPSVTATVGTPTGTVTATVTGTPTATATSGPTDTSGNNNYGDPSSSAEPTKVVFTQPTSGSHDSGPLQGLSPGAFTSNGLLLATTMSCLVTVLGVVVAAVAMSSLLRGGYGPFLRALAFGRRAGNGTASNDKPNPAVSRDDWELSEELGAISENYRVPVRARADYGAPRSAPPQARGSRQSFSSRPDDRW